MLSALDRLLCFLLLVIIHSSFPYEMSFEWDTDGLLKLKELMPGGTVLQMGLMFLFSLLFLLFMPFLVLTFVHFEFITVQSTVLSLLMDPVQQPRSLVALYVLVC